ncbi:efflux RND transporter periplasmic adaptor subunit [Parashewanella curva]|uniref:Efflux RND transporter periplasmic adaptor subunit n=1 Tax=Parashewanella curva TaxID=2338552 RepID=A0A3L8Q070_9GAMM|nr:efflux RND transporter periplasmic adaptor subunit [Parashewanella curva]RLV59752.1 efflux RND transporter periplasmic adaptor subunit [Parashewanella curva]
MNDNAVWVRRFSPLIIIIIFIGLYFLSTQNEAISEQAPPPPVLPIVEVMSVEPYVQPIVLDSFGVVKPKNQTRLAAEVSGRVVELADVFVSGGMVKQGDVLARIDDADYQADLLQAEANLAKANAELDAEKARGEVAKVEFKGHSQAPSLGLRIPQLQQEQAKVKSAKAALSRAQRNLERTVIRAPYNAIVKSRVVNLGQYVTKGAEVGEVLDISTAEVRLPVASDDLIHLNSITKPNAKVILKLDLAGKLYQWPAKLVRSEGVVDSQSRMVYLVAEVQKPYQSLAQGMPLQFGSFVNADIQGKEQSNLIRLPRHLVRDEFVALIDTDSKVDIRDLDVVYKDESWVYINGSIAQTERVSLTRFDRLDDGQGVEVAESQTSELALGK